MRDRDSLALRLELARGHWTLGEHHEAAACLERAVKMDPTSLALAELLDAFTADPVADIGAHERLMGVRAMVEKAVEEGEAEVALGAGMETPTMAELLASQGHVARATEVCEAILTREPENTRVRALLDRMGVVPAPTSPEAEAAAEAAEPAPADLPEAPAVEPEAPVLASAVDLLDDDGLAEDEDDDEPTFGEDSFRAETPDDLREPAAAPTPAPAGPPAPASPLAPARRPHAAPALPPPGEEAPRAAQPVRAPQPEPEPRAPAATGRGAHDRAAEARVASLERWLDQLRSRAAERRAEGDLRP